MGSQFSAPVKIRSERSRRGLIALLLVLAVLAAITVTGTGIASAVSNYSGFIGPRIVDGGVDVNGDNIITSADDATNFFGSTDVVNGLFDCDEWEDTINEGAQGDNTTEDDCVLRGFFGEGSSDYYIWVDDGYFTYYAVSLTDAKSIIYDGWRLPARYIDDDTWDDDTSIVLPGAMAWRFVDGRLDYNHSGGAIETDGTDDRADYIGLLDIDDGYFDANGDDDATLPDTQDDCYNGCFWGLNVLDGKLQTTGPSYPSASGSTGPQGTAGTNGVSGRVSISASTSTNSMNKSKSAMCSGTTKVMGGGYTITAAASTLAHLTVVANGQISGGWKVRVLEATPTAGTWAVTVNVICATA